jgi:hypothetical protein
MVLYFLNSSLSVFLCLTLSGLVGAGLGDRGLADVVSIQYGKEPEVTSIQLLGDFEWSSSQVKFWGSSDRVLQCVAAPFHPHPNIFSLLTASRSLVAASTPAFYRRAALQDFPPVARERAVANNGQVTNYPWGVARVGRARTGRTGGEFEMRDTTLCRGIRKTASQAKNF